MDTEIRLPVVHDEGTEIKQTFSQQNSRLSTNNYSLPFEAGTSSKCKTKEAIILVILHIEQKWQGNNA
jgi:hypothetical protein